MSKLGILLGAGVGYVLGTRDGRERYEQIRAQAQRVWKDPRVHEKKQQATEVAKQKGGELQDKASQKASQKASEKASGASGDTEDTSSSPSSASPSGAGAPSVPVTATTDKATGTGTGTPSTTSPSTPSSSNPVSGASGSPAPSGTSAGKSNPVQKNG